MSAPLALAAAALILLPGTAVAADSLPTIRKGTATAAPYSGRIQALSFGEVYFSGNAPFIGLVDTTCQYAQLRGGVNSDGTGGYVNFVQIDNNGSGAACPNNQGGTTTITAIDTNGTGVIRYDDSHVNSRDTFLRLPGNQPGVKIKAVIEMPAVTTEPQTCYYGLTADTPDMEIDLFNPDNPSRPDPLLPQAQGSAQGQQFYLMTTETNDVYCPEAAAAFANVVVKGETVADSGTYDQKLYATKA
ncbi:hypothetical protein [Nonomuraea typhae]|uniref:Uncharacterized protein n=1 Tax=Nonomuraea typhae TaxID=2603600 RepID=A0ABW7YJY1_9ACTN